MENKEDIEVKLPFWYMFNKKKVIEDFFNLKIFNLFKKEFMEWEEYKKKVEDIDEDNFKKSLIKEE